MLPHMTPAQAVIVLSFARRLFVLNDTLITCDLVAHPNRDTNMADQLNMNGLSLDGPHGQGRSAYIPPHMRGMPPPQMDGPPGPAPSMNGQMNGNAWNAPCK